MLDERNEQNIEQSEKVANYLTQTRILEDENNLEMHKFMQKPEEVQSKQTFSSFKNYYKSKHSYARADEDMKDLYSRHIDKFWDLANRQVNALNDEGMREFLSYVISELKKEEMQSESKKVENKMLLDSILRNLPENLSEENIALRTELEEMLNDDFNLMK